MVDYVNSVMRQAAKTALFAAGDCVGSRKNRQETIFPIDKWRVSQ
jgi:hypothetical protein